MYLTKKQLHSNLSLGKSVEQWLGYKEGNDFVSLKWIRIDKEKNNTYSVTYFEVLDEGSMEFLDIYEFESIDPDEPYGYIFSFNNIEEAINFSRLEYNVSLERFVNSGLIQEEYKIYLQNKM